MTAQLVWILAPRLPEPDGVAQATAGLRRLKRSDSTTCCSSFRSAWVVSGE